MPEEKKLTLITRDYEKSIKLAQAFKDKGLSTIIFPLFRLSTNKISFFSKIIFKINSHNIAFAISSSNAIPYLDQVQLNKNIRIFAIGEKTAKNLEESGYKNVKFAENSVISLLELVKNYVSKKDSIIYLSGEIITLDLATELEKQGFNAKRIVAYKILEEENFSEEIIEKIKNNQITQAVIYSKNTLNIFYKLLSKHNLLEYCKEIKLLCLSNEIIDYSSEIGFPKSENINKIIN